MNPLLRCLLALFLSLPFLSAQEHAAPDEPPRLPRLFIVGDSISLAYTPIVKRELEGKMIVERVPGNCRYAAWGAEHVREWVGDKHWDIIHFNFGLWDLYGWKQEERISVEDYAKHLDTIVWTLKRHCDVLVFGTTTPPCAEPEHKIKVEVTPEQSKAFNDAARAVMKRHGVLVNDLHAVLDGRMEEHGKGPADVHFKPSGNELLGKTVAAFVDMAVAVQAGGFDGLPRGRTIHVEGQVIRPRGKGAPLSLRVQKVDDLPLDPPTVIPVVAFLDGEDLKEGQSLRCWAIKAGEYRGIPLNKLPEGVPIWQGRSWMFEKELQVLKVLK